MVKSSYDHRSNISDHELQRLKKQAELVQDQESALLKHSGLKEDSIVLELGCGPGFFTPVLIALIPQGQIFAVDLDAEVLKAWEKNITVRPKQGATSVLTDGKSLPLKDQSVDFIYARFILQHSPDVTVLLKECFRVLKPRGVLCVLDSDDGLILIEPPMPKIESLLIAAQERQIENGGDRFVGRKLFSYLQKANFSEIQTKVLTFTSTQLPSEMFVKILFGQKFQQAKISKEQLSGLNTEIREKIDRQETHISAGVFFVSGRAAK